MARTRHRLVEKARVARLVAAHQREDLSHHRVAGLHAAAQLLVEEEAGELGCAGALQELDEDLARRPADAFRSLAEAVVAHEVLLVVVVTELGEHAGHLLLVQPAVPLAGPQAVHLLKVGGVEARRQHVLLGSNLDALARLDQASLTVHVRGRRGVRRPHARRARRARAAAAQRSGRGGAQAHATH